MVNNEPMNTDDQATASKMLERVVSQIPLDFTFVLATTSGDDQRHGMD